MREIKFRAWDKEDNKMVYGTSLIMNEGKWFIMPTEYIDVWHEVEFVTQYTGRKDIEGVDVYEGDIVKFEKMSAM